jgi:hypothetical protein
MMAFILPIMAFERYRRLKPAHVSGPQSKHSNTLRRMMYEYKKNTGNDLQSHPLTVELQSCDSVDAISAILQRQVNTVEKLRDRNGGIMKWISSSVHILHTISATLGDGAGLVRRMKRTCGY